jgi:uncharacterized membrane protein
MTELFVAGYPDLAKAQEVQDRMLHLQADQHVGLNDLVAVENQAGQLLLHQPRGTVSVAGALSGALGGGLIGLLYLAPLLGLAANASGASTDPGIDHNLRKHLTRTLTAGSAAVLMLVAGDSAGTVLAELAPHEGLLQRSALSADQEICLRQAVAAARALTAAN